MNLNLQSRRIQVLSALVASFFALGPAMAGQSGIGLKIVVLEDSGARAVVSRPASGPIKLRVLDAGNRVVPGATVVFSAPESGPSCYFLNGSHSMIVFTDLTGLAVAQDYGANSTAGGYQIKVQAAYMGEVVTLPIAHTNLVPKKSSKMFLIGAAAGGAVAAIFAVKAANSSSSSSPAPITGGPTPPRIVRLGSSGRGSK